MVLLKINYDDLYKLESLTMDIKQSILKKSLTESILATSRAVSQFAIKKIERDGTINIDRNILEKRIKLSKISTGSEIKDIASYLRFSTINESLSSFSWKKTTAKGTDGKRYSSFIANVLGKTIEPIPKTFISGKKKISLKRVGKSTYPVRKAFVENSSISDMLRFNGALLDAIIQRACRKYESEIQRNVRWNLMKM